MNRPARPDAPPGTAPSKALSRRDCNGDNLSLAREPTFLGVEQTFNLGEKMKRTISTLTVAPAALVLGYLFGAPKPQTFNSSAAVAAPAPVPMAVPVPHGCQTRSCASPPAPQAPWSAAQSRFLFGGRDGQAKPARKNRCQLSGIRCRGQVTHPKLESRKRSAQDWACSF